MTSGWRLPSGLGTLARFLLWGLLIVATVVLVAWIVRRLLAARAAADVGPDAGAASRPAPPAEEDLPDHRRLALAGRWEEAVHALLLAAFHELCRRDGLALPKSLTAREVIESVGGRERTRGLGILVGAVERSRFGLRPLGSADYEGCAAALAGWQGSPGGRPA